jgi:N-acetylmuramoyl-L-alanine amidase
MQGEHISSISRKYGFPNWDKVWDHPDNAGLKNRREDPNVLYPGDAVTIPDLRVGEEAGETDMRHRFKLKTPTLMLRFVLKDVCDVPVSSNTCRLIVEGEVYELTTDAGGMIEQKIPLTAQKGSLEIDGNKVKLQIGHLDPVSETTGQRARLNNLGYNAGPMDCNCDDRLRSAIEEFQCDADLYVDGICGSNTQARLIEVYGC